MGDAFFGRERLLSRLAERLAGVRERGQGEIISLRGRRQVGKSTLLERFVESAGAPYVYVTGRFGAARRVQLERAHAALRESSRPLPDLDLVAAGAPADWEEWFARLAVPARSGPVVVVIDEFPWIVGGDPSLEGVLQVAWDRLLEKLPVLVILVGSDVAMMERLTAHERPLFGRVRPMHVPALSPAELQRALPEWPAHDVLDAQLVTGGYPRLAADLRARPSGGIRDYVRDALEDPYSPLVATGRLTLDAEFPSPHDAARVLRAIGASERATPGFNDIVGALSTEAERSQARTATTRALRLLTDAKRLIEREVPALSSPSSKLRRYRVADPYLRFWFRYVDPVVEHIERGRSDIAIGRFERDWASWRGQAIEPVVRESLYRLAATDDRLAGVEAVSPWWRNATRAAPDVEVDIVAADRTAPLVVGSIKWRSGGGIASQEVDELRAHRDAIPAAAGAKLAFVTPRGDLPEGVDLAFGAQDLVAAWV